MMRQSALTLCARQVRICGSESTDGWVGEVSGTLCKNLKGRAYLWHGASHKSSLSGKNMRRRDRTVRSRHRRSGGGRPFAEVGCARNRAERKFFGAGQHRRKGIAIAGERATSTEAL